MKAKNHQKITALFPLLLTTVILFAACGTVQPANDSTAAAGAALPAAENAAGNMAGSTAASAGNTAASVGGTVDHTITVNSSEKVTVVPDIAQVVYAVRTDAKDAAACQQKNTEDVNSVIELLKSLGIEEKSIQTSDYSMYPIYNYSNNTQKITGYEATASLTVSDLPIENLSNILSESVTAGVNNIQSITYQSSQYDQAYADALKLAVTSAKTKADALAEAGGCSLGNVVNISENSNYSEARYTDYALTSKMNSQTAAYAAGVEDSNAIMPGEVDIEVNITVEYLIQ